MFPPKGQQIWNEDLLWQGEEQLFLSKPHINRTTQYIWTIFPPAIPIHTMPEQMDHVLAMKRPCPRYQKAYEEYLQSDEIKSILESNRTMIEYMEKHAGMRFVEIRKIKAFYEALWIEQLKGFT